MTDIRQSKEYADYLTKTGWIVERINGINYFIKKIPLIGSVLKIQRPNELRFREIKRLREKYRVFQIIIEPDLSCSGLTSHHPLITRGFKLSKSPYLPSKTLCLDLTKPLRFPKETKRCLRIGERSIIKEYSSPNEIKTFRNAWKKAVKFTRFVPPAEQLINLRQSFPNNYTLFLASHNNIGRIIGGSIFTRSSHDSAYYWQAFTNKEGSTSLSQYTLLHQGILWAKKRGCKIFDFEGIYDSRFPNKSWLGFTRFKKSFGTHEVSYPGCYTKFRFPT